VAQGAQDFVTNQEYVAAGIELEQNSPDEITAMVAEMIDRIEGRTIGTDSDRALQERMRAHIARSVRFRDWQFEASPSFLRKHQSLL
jgi:thioesterase domain-containing protein